MRRRRNVQMEWKCSRIFRENQLSTASIVLNIGGARSGKSYSLLQLMAYRFLTEENKKILITRKTLTSLKRGGLLQWRDIIGGVPVKENRSDLIFRYKDNMVFFFSVENSERIKSTEFNYIFADELTEFTFEEFQMLKLRISAPTKTKNQMYCAMNPMPNPKWIWDILVNDPEVHIIKSNYKDNPFLSEDYKRELERLKDIDEAFYKIYALGERADLGDFIYTHFRRVSDFPQTGYVWYGLDWGLVNPTAVVKVTYLDGAYYVEEVFYQSGVTIFELIPLLRREVKGNIIYADPSNPENIEIVRRAGINIIPANNDVLAGINFVRSVPVCITNKSVNLWREVQTYVWVKRGEEILERPVKFNDHLLDAMRYAIFSYGRNRVNNNKIYSIRMVESVTEGF